MDTKVAVVTGANAGVGLSLSERLLSEHENLKLCLACRNRGRAENAREKLLRRHPNADISIIIVDTSSVESVLKASQEIKTKFQRLDYLYLNAGIMKITSINLSKVLAIFSHQGARILSTGWGVLNHDDNVTSEGLQEVFATNLFGHYVMVRELEDFCEINGSTKVIWTSSQNASIEALDYNDIQHRNGTEPYSSSKYATDVLNVALNNRLNKKGIYSITTCPGFVLSNLTFGLLPAWIWMICIPFLYFMRLFVSSLTCSTYNGAEVLLWASKQKNESLNPRIKYCSCCSITGRTYIGEEKLKVEESDADNLYKQLDELYQGFKQKYTSEKNGTHLLNAHSNGHTNGHSSGHSNGLIR